MKIFIPNYLIYSTKYKISLNNFMKIKKYTEFLNEDVDIDDLSVGEIGSLHV